MDHSKELNLDIVLICDKSDEKAVYKKLLPHLKKHLMQHKELFEHWDGNQTVLRVLDFEILQNIILHTPKLLGNNIKAKSTNEILKTIKNSPSQKIPDIQIPKLEEEFNFLKSKLKKISILPKKCKIALRMLEIARILENGDNEFYLSNLISDLRKEIYLTKIRMNHHLFEAKKELSKAINVSLRTASKVDMKNVFLHFHSFSIKFARLKDDKSSKIYRDLSLQLINNDERHIENFKETFNLIMSIPDDIEILAPCL